MPGPAPSGIPRLRSVDSSLALMREGYRFISRRCDRLGSDAFRTRIMLAPVVAMRGPDAAALVYGSGRFGRKGAMPTATLRLLQDRGSVQLLTGPAHRHRKAIFLDLMRPPALERARARFAAELDAALPRWQAAGSVRLHDAIREVLTRTACAWAGLPLAESEVPSRTREFTAMIDRAGTVGPSNWWAQRLRRRSEAWARNRIDRARSGAIPCEPATALAALARRADFDGTPIARDAAAVELLNILRPTVAVGRFITFAAHALARHPGWSAAFAAGAEGDLEPFVQEVRRFYPFFPAIGARAIEPVEWRGHRFAAGDWVLLDLYGTNRDPRLWDEPEAFRPERFRDWPGDPYALIPQGGGRFETDHRCPGEWLTIELTKEAVRFLTRRIRYVLPPQDLGISLRQIPALPKSGVRIENPLAADRGRTWP